ncbi:peptidoglycan-binding protein [Streptomyces sp. DH8]|uniref:peptidoglycan-binding protein n=1 Tax=Streptomyces sp. DH8 TaxID=2857008 RepID=UPI001E3B10F9|nr:peptidoglycan-binding protein [Streptomyces sp. DH8]
MKLVTRAQLGWPASAAPSQPTALGVKVHYEGTPVSTKLLTDHDACLDEWKNIRRSHLANTRENYSDVAYNYAACPHGYLLEGRGLRRRTGANGSAALNRAHFAILGLVGSSGLTEPPAAMLSAIRDGIDLLRKNGAGAEIKGHRDGFATACPGGPLYAWVKKGAPRPDGDGEEKPEGGGGAKKPVVDLSRLVAAARTDPPKKGTPVSYSGAKVVEQALVKEGLLAKGLADGHFGSATVAAYAKLQRRYGYTGRDADGIPGRTTLTRLGKAHGFTVKD